MPGWNFELLVTAEDDAAADRAATSLADTLRELDGVIEVARGRTETHSMNIGDVVRIVTDPHVAGALATLAAGIAAWLRMRRGAKIVIRRQNGRGSVKAIISGIDPEAATRIIEEIMRAS
jgi:hypothetical protein